MAEFQAKYETAELNPGQRFRKATWIQAKYETIQLNLDQQFRKAIRIQVKYETHQVEPQATVS